MKRSSPSAVAGGGASIRFCLSSIRLILADVREILRNVMLALSFVSTGLC